MRFPVRAKRSADHKKTPGTAGRFYSILLAEFFESLLQVLGDHFRAAAFDVVAFDEVYQFAILKRAMEGEEGG